MQNIGIKPNAGPLDVLKELKKMNDDQDRLGYVTDIQKLLGMQNVMNRHWHDVIGHANIGNASQMELKEAFIFFKNHIIDMVNTTMALDDALVEKDIEIEKISTENLDVI